MQCSGMSRMPALSSRCKNETSSLSYLMHIEYVFRSTQHNCFPWQTEQRSQKSEMQNKCLKKKTNPKANSLILKSGSFEHCTHILPQNCSCSNQHNHQPAAFPDKLVGTLSVLQLHDFSHHTSNTFIVGGNQAAFLIHVNISRVFLNVHPLFVS